MSVTGALFKHFKISNYSFKKSQYFDSQGNDYMFFLILAIYGS